MSTLVTEPFFDVVPRFFGMTLDELWEVKDRTSWIDFEYGRIGEEEHKQRFFKDGRDWDVEGLKAAMQESIEWTAGMDDLVRRLADAGYEMHTLSNYSRWYHLIEAKLGISKYVPWTFVSCDIGHRKPDASTYEHVVQHLDVAPADCLFVDDRQKNVDGAEAIGMPGLVFVDTPTLERHLIERGLQFDTKV